MSRGTDSEEPDGLQTILPSNNFDFKWKMPNDFSPQTEQLILDESLEEDLAHLHREMETIRLECDRLMRNTGTKELAKQKCLDLDQKTSKLNIPLIQFHKPLVNNSQKQNNTQTQLKCCPALKFKKFNNELISKDLTNEKQTKEQQCDFSNGNFQMPLNQEQTTKNNKLLPLKTKKLFQSNQNQIINNNINNKPAFNVNSSSVVFVEETSSSAYNTGGDSCRSTPMNYTEQYNYKCNEQNIKDRPKNLNIFKTKPNIKTNVIDSSNQKTPFILSSPENFYHTIDTPTPSTIVPTVSNMPTSNIKPINNTVQFRLVIFLN